jgi:hypothetical protein
MVVLGMVLVMVMEANKPETLIFSGH